MTTPSTTLTQPGLVRADRGPFGLPKGLSGRLAGRLMAANDEQQRELSQLVEIPPKGSLCEVGFGPGVLLGLLRARFPDASLCGVDPSTVMLRQAARAIGDAAIDLRCAAAGDLPFEDDTFDVTVSFNTMQFWPDRNAGLREIRRVTRPGGKVLISWHGGTAPTRIQRRLVLATPSWLVSPLPSASTSATSANNTSPSLSSSPPSSEPAPDDPSHSPDSNSRFFRLSRVFWPLFGPVRREVVEGTPCMQGVSSHGAFSEGARRAPS